MSIGSATSAPNPALLSLLSQLTGPQSATGGSSDFSASATPSGGSAQSANNQITGSGSASISSEILKLLVQMQQQLGSAASGSSTTTTASTSTMANPVSTMASAINQLFSAMDTDGDGSVSESEMEGYIEKQGGTQAQADALYTQLDQNSASGVSQQQLAGAVQPPGGGGGHHHHHHHIGGGGDSMASSLIQALDTDGDGSVSEDEFSNFITANGGTSAEASSDFSALDNDGSGALTTASLTKAWENLQNTQVPPSSGSVMASLLDTLAKANAATPTSSTTV
jgi:Ca2+-binding EF-hand superfamily protein